jgi:hypothetical protein
MNTQELIESLGRDVRPVPRHSVERKIAFALILGIIGSIALIVATIGIRPDLSEAMGEADFWVKWIYTASLAIIAAGLTFRLARPEAATFARWWLAIPVVLIALIGIAELAAAPPSHWLAMWLGRTASKCPFLVFGLSIPILGCLLWSMRRLAPTRLAAAGAAAGLTAGAFAATVYCLHCPETSAVFVLTWYSLGIAFATGVGAFLGPRLLRW